MILAGVLGACGGASDEESAASAAGDYLGAFADGDGSVACQQLNAEAQGYVVQFAAARGLGTLDCAQAISQISASAPHATLEAFSSSSEEIGSDDVAISGSAATVTVPRTPTPLYLQKDGEDWKLTATGVEGSFATTVP